MATDKHTFYVMSIILIIVIALGVLSIPVSGISDTFGTTADKPFNIKKHQQGVIVNDPNLKVELVTEDLEFPTSMAFIGSDDILVLEKNEGTVKRIVNGQMLKEPMLDVNVGNDAEKGMLGIAIGNKNVIDNNERILKTYVFLYFTETRTKDGEDVTDGKDPLGNRLYRYELENNKLVHPKLLLELPAKSDLFHNGGRLLIGPDNNLYFGIGDFIYGKNTTAENVEKGSEPDGTSGILRITQDGEPVGNGVLGSSFPLNLYYAYGIRNSFGMDFDPVTGKLWDTENGPDYGDEINLVESGFNSGWNIVQGFWKPKGLDKGDRELQPDNLVDFNGKGMYSSPEFAWNFTVGPTALKFLTSDKLGKEYENDMFVGDFHYGNIYHFDLEKKRTGLLLEHSLSDKIGDDLGESEIIKFGAGFGGITDLVIGPDGYLYILSLLKGGHNCDSNEESCISYSSEKGAAIMRIVPTIANSENKID
jgi:glucose/arabinose dehydrogenase